VFKYADRLRSKYVVIVAPDEISNGEVAVKDMDSGEQQIMKVESLTEWASEL